MACSPNRQPSGRMPRSTLATSLNTVGMTPAAKALRRSAATFWNTTSTLPATDTSVASVAVKASSPS